jgi:DNA-binding winged helix-turn-helix (wHTH) protein
MSEQPLQLVLINEDEQDADNRRVSSSSGKPIGFGEFIALPAARTLTRRGKTVALGGRAFDLLIVLLRSRGALVTREEIIRYVWPSTTVDESNLRFQMACLRKALGAARDYIKTVPGRGYLFIGDHSEDVGAEHSVSIPAARIETRHHHRPAIFVIDRDDVIRDALDRLLRPFDAQIASFASVEALLESATIVRHTGCTPLAERPRLAC